MKGFHTLRSLLILISATASISSGLSQPIPTTPVTDNMTLLDELDTVVTSEVQETAERLAVSIELLPRADNRQPPPFSPFTILPPADSPAFSYTSSRVADVVDRTYIDLRNDLDLGVGLEPTRAYVDDLYRQSIEDLSKSSRGQQVSIWDAQRIFQRFTELFTAVQRRESMWVTLELKSSADPTDIRIEHGDPPRNYGRYSPETVTVPISSYMLSAQRPMHKNAEPVELNLVRNQGSIIECQMVELGADAYSVCHLKSQADE